MATTRHPETGVELNLSPIVRHGKLSAAEMRTGELLQLAGDPRWVAAQRLGAHPLAFPAISRTRESRRKISGRHLSHRAAAEDPRQDDMAALLELQDQRRPRPPKD